jgi:hypothetical protein
MKSTARIGLGFGALALAFAGLAQAGGDKATGHNFKDLDKNQDGRVSMVEAQPQSTLRSSFTALDRNADGYLNQAEFSGWKMDHTPAPGSTTPGSTPTSESRSSTTAPESR